MKTKTQAIADQYEANTPARKPGETLEMYTARRLAEMSNRARAIEAWRNLGDYYAIGNIVIDRLASAGTYAPSDPRRVHEVKHTHIGGAVNEQHGHTGNANTCPACQQYRREEFSFRAVTMTHALEDLKQEMAAQVGANAYDMTRPAWYLKD